MKKFNVEKIGTFGERLGRWDVAENHKDVKSPGLWLTTSACGVPHLTPETIHMSGLMTTTNISFAGFLVSYEKHARSIDVYQDFKKGFRRFSGLPDAPIMVTVMDPMLKAKSGYNTSKSISVWGESNHRELVDVHQYKVGLEALKPDIFVSLCDSDIPKDSGSTKRAQKATKFTQNSVDYLMEQNENCLHVGPIGGSYIELLRQKNAQWMASKHLDGYLLDGFHSNGETSLEVDLKQVLHIIENFILPSLSAAKPRLYFGMVEPYTVLKLVQIGVDFFETSFAYYKTELGHALTFKNSLNTIGKASDDEKVLGKNNLEDSVDVNDVDFIDLNLPKYKNDFGPILQTCSCYTCRKHTRGYINHLLATKELLAGVLLTIHNLHHYATFFETIREAIALDAFEQLLKHFESKVEQNE